MRRHRRRRPSTSQWEKLQMNPSLTARRRNQPYQQLDLGLLSSETIRKYISGCLSHPACGTLLWQPKQTNRPFLAQNSETSLHQFMNSMQINISSWVAITSCLCGSWTGSSSKVGAASNSSVPLTKPSPAGMHSTCFFCFALFCFFGLKH